VRLAAASVLVELYKEDAHVSMLSKFTMRFAGRYAELVYDLNENVSVQGVSALRSCRLTADKPSGIPDRISAKLFVQTVCLVVLLICIGADGMSTLQIPKIVSNRVSASVRVRRLQLEFHERGPNVCSHCDRGTYNELRPSRRSS
jgi:hypothetical protein